VRADQLFELVQTRLEKEVNRSYRHYIDRLLDQGHTATDIAAGVFELLRESMGREGQAIDEDNPNFKPDKKRKERKDRGERYDKRDRKGGKGQKKDPNMTTLFLSLGKAASVRPADILGMCYREGSIPDSSVGRIQLFERHSLIDVHKDVAIKIGSLSHISFLW